MLNLTWMFIREGSLEVPLRGKRGFLMIIFGICREPADSSSSERNIFVVIAILSHFHICRYPSKHNYDMRGYHFVCNETYRIPYTIIQMRPVWMRVLHLHPSFHLHMQYLFTRCISSKMTSNLMIHTTSL